MTIFRLNPKLMAIGDSLPQGCRSLTVKAQFCAQSWPARIAAEQGWSFVSPDHPRPVLFDLEEELRRLDPVLFSPKTLALAAGLPLRLTNNLKQWRTQAPGSKNQSFDNVAIAGSEVHDLYSRSAKHYESDIRDHTQGNILEHLDSIPNLHIAINGKYVLNPQGNPDFDDFSQLDWVEARQPEILLIQSGHNHGLFEFGFQGKHGLGITRGVDPQGRDYFEQWAVVAQRIARLPDAVRHVVIVLLPKVGGVASLMPRTNDRENGYAESYLVRLMPQVPSLAGTLVASVDHTIVEVNQRIQDIFLDASRSTQTQDRLHFVDSYQQLEAIDYKNRLDPALRLRATSEQLIDNRYLDGKLDFSAARLTRLKAGGYLSVDGMHPSGFGYADIASKVMTELNLPHKREPLLARAFREDELLSNYPLELDAVTRYIDLLRSFSQANWFVAQETPTLRDDTHLTQTLEVFSKAFFR
ncbi:hypothetical protein [Pseudomonas sp. NPDC089534]|uniref:hypothetical protein n=1 Tax=Pseudomonas sp. NPDC089534 TaxID=3364468 RepID=UPI00381B0BB2